MELRSSSMNPPDAIQRLPDVTIAGRSALVTAFRQSGCRTFREAARHVWELPYGRNSDRADYRLVLAEAKGSCSTKHALIAALGQELGINIGLALALYDMDERNTPGVGRVLAENRLASIPEAHCFLRYCRAVIDLTVPSVAGVDTRRYYKERVIRPEDIGSLKESFHRRALSEWLSRQHRPDLDLEKIWEIRNACIAALTG